MENEEDNIANCEKNLLEHIMTMQDKIEERMNAMEEQITGEFYFNLTQV